jgi:hypothetical protein
LAADPVLSKLGQLLKEVREQLQTNLADGVLRAIFAANNEIGRLSRTGGDLRESLFELQTNLNLVTIQVKRGRFSEARESLRKVDETFGLMSRPRVGSQKEFIERRGAETN